MREEDKIQKAREAEELLNNDLLKNALKGMEDTLIYNLKTSHWKNTDEREEIYRQLVLIPKFVERLSYWIREGADARAKLDTKLKKVV
jgi:hypothetical protein